MSQLREISNIQQDNADLNKRWFASDEDDLYLWTSDGELYVFEYCYDKKNVEHVFRWHSQHANSHTRIDLGDNPGGHKRSPIAIPDGNIDKNHIINCFESAGGLLEPGLYEQILGELNASL